VAQALLPEQGDIEKAAFLALGKAHLLKAYI
jgi:hypothetical protein